VKYSKIPELIKDLIDLEKEKFMDNFNNELNHFINESQKTDCKKVKLEDYQNLFSKFDIKINHDKFVDKDTQSKLLGEFNNPDIELPIDGDHINMNVLNLVSKDFIQNGTENIIDNIINTDNRFKIIYSPSGFGKTYALSSVSIRKLSIFCVSNGDKGSNGTKSSDISFYQFYNKIKELKIDEHIFYYNNLILKYILVRITYLYLQVFKNGDISPKIFYISQLNSNQNKLLELYDLIENGLVNVSNSCLEDLINQISIWIKNKNIQKINFILDESNFLIKSSRNQYLSSNGTMRSLLIPLISNILKFDIFNIILASTEFDSDLYSHIASTVLKFETIPAIFYNFKGLNQVEQTIISLKKYINLSDIELDNDLIIKYLKLITGRPRLITATIETLFKYKNETKFTFPEIDNSGLNNKSKVLLKTIKEVFDFAIGNIFSLISSKYELYNKLDSLNKSEKNDLKKGI
jgi:hypothetical protein